MKVFDELFTKHPAEAGQTYWEHGMFAANFGALALIAGSAAMIHALLPCVFQRTASTLVLRLADSIHQRASATPVMPRVRHDSMASSPEVPR